jgi:hypothetical protein
MSRKKEKKIRKIIVKKIENVMQNILTIFLVSGGFQ